MNYQDDPKSHYSVSLDQYLNEGIGWDARCFRNTERGDMEQFAADSFHAGWLAKQGENLANTPKERPQTLVQELTQVINWRSLENGSNTPDFILADFLSRCLVAFDDSIKNRTNWYGQKMKDLEFKHVINLGPAPDLVYKTPGYDAANKKAEALWNIHKTPYGANLGINSPEIVPGLTFGNIHMPGHTFYVFTVDTEKNSIGVQINRPASEGGHGWPEDWNLEHTRAGFERGEYWEIKEAINEELEKAGITQRIHICPYCSHKHFGAVARGNIICSSCKNIFPVLGRDLQAEALKKRQFPAGGVVDGMRKQAAREIMADIENKTAETLHGSKKEYEFIPAALWEEYQANEKAIADLASAGKCNTKEFNELATKARDLSRQISEVKTDAFKKKSADDLARMVANVKTVTDAFLKSAKAIKIFTDESREADAILVRLGQYKATKATKGPITDKTGFLFLRHKGVEWLFHDGCRYLCCEWDGSEWVGWQVPEEFAIKAAETQLPAYLEQYVRGFYPTK